MLEMFSDPSAFYSIIVLMILFAVFYAIAKRFHLDIILSPFSLFPISDDEPDWEFKVE